MKTIKRNVVDQETRNKRTNIILGAGVLVLALIGAITVVALIINMFASLFDDSKKKLQFENFIKPVVMVDPVAFADVTKADEHSLLMSSMWNLLMNIGENTSYPEDEYGMMIIPSSDVSISAANLFGSDVNLTHQTFGNSSINFEYNAETESYIVPPMGYSIQYQPRVDKIKRKGKLYTLTVSYISSTANVGKSESGSDSDKEMLYVLEKTGKDKYVIRSIQDPSDNVSSLGGSSSLKNDSSVITKTESEVASSEKTSSKNTSSKANSSSKSGSSSNISSNSKTSSTKSSSVKSSSK